ncbi:NAD-dependent epimerase/dehydratase family protein [Mycobacterium sp. Y57]|uniref:NAD-dependent epimerase/dehydratase family protein n=1 Tax=Mycolicibacterium xanthum TaxID=2796469 RepID=UPI001C8478D4|nr:NAD-dependent epimerase/dehydratase family protein [Mycolicibacterium xanthum]MBX7431384.1 NAD-dependent epimerase/dehydratase family protein [Mycolicibacterium xanthum]
MKVLVTGGTGFTGSHTAVALAARGHDVRLMVRDPAKVDRVFSAHNFSPTDIVVGDMTDADAVDAALAGCDGVVHTAALVDLRRAAAGVVEETNQRGVEVVVGTAARRGLDSIVHVSSLAVFFTPGGPPLSPLLPIAPGATAYSRSKATAERYVRRLQEQGVPIRISYPAGIVGPDDPGPSALNNGLIAYMRGGWLLTSSGLQCVDVRDLATLHATLLELPAGPHRYSAATEMLTWPEFHDMCCELTGLRLRRIPVPGPVLRAAGTIGDVVKRFHDFDFPLTRDAMEVTTRWPGADTARTTAELGVVFRDRADTFRDTLQWMYRAGHLSAEQVGKLATTREVGP